MAARVRSRDDPTYLRVGSCGIAEADKAEFPITSNASLMTLRRLRPPILALMEARDFNLTLSHELEGSLRCDSWRPEVVADVADPSCHHRTSQPRASAKIVVA